MTVLTTRIFFPIAVGAIMIGLGAQRARGQYCPASNLTYIVRDAKGKPIDVTRTDLQYEKDSGAPRSAGRRWEVHNPDLKANPSSQSSGTAATLMNKTSTLRLSEYCHFNTPVTLRLILKGKTMNLTFLVPPVTDYKSRGEPADFVVDSIPFHAGTFEITLSLPKNRDYQSVNYSNARDWKKISN